MKCKICALELVEDIKYCFSCPALSSNKAHSDFTHYCIRNNFNLNFPNTEQFQIENEYFIFLDFNKNITKIYISRLKKGFEYSRLEDNLLLSINCCLDYEKIKSADKINKILKMGIIS